VARRSGSTAVQEDLYPPPRAAGYDASERELFDDARTIDLEAEQESPFLRAQKRVSVRRGTFPQKTAARLKWVALALVALVILGAFATALYRYGKHSWRFRIDSSDQIQVSGAEHVPHAQIMEVMGGDIGRNIFFIPLALRKQQLEQIPWVESASVMRFVPNRLRIEIHERTPVAFARIGSHISLIDVGGNLMELSPARHAGSRATGKYSFPVIAGMNASEPVSTRAARMKNYNELMRQLDSGGGHYSQEISEVDLTDNEDVKVLTSDPSGEVLVHLGTGNYLQRYKVYVTHVQAWRQQFTKLDSVDLRYDGQIIVNPDLEGMSRQPALTPTAAKAALAAGVKSAAIVNYEKFVTHPAPPPAPTKPSQAKTKTPAKAEAKAKAKSPKAVVRHAKLAPRIKATAPKNTAALPATASPAQGKTSPAKTVTSSANAKPTAASSNPVTPAPPAAQVAATPRPPATNRTVTPAANETAASPAATKSSKPSPVTPAPSTSVSVTQKKPSPAIPKEAPQN